MESESECSVLELVEDNEVTGHTKLHVDDVNDCGIKDNGSCTNDDPIQRSAMATDTDRIDEFDALTGDNHVKGTAGIVQPMHSAFEAVKSPGGSSSPATKGYGLKKWRRIKRDFVNDAPAMMDNSKILKRGLVGSANPNPSKPQHRESSPEIRHNSGSPVGHMNMLKNASVAHGFLMHSPNSDSMFAVGAATDSENSEDRSSKSSTAASMPKARYDLPVGLGYMHEKNLMKNLGNLSQRIQQGKGRAESSKKARGVRVKIEKENSHSSMESDSRSSNIFFTQGPISVTSNGKKSGNSLNYGENSDDAHEDEHQISEEAQTAYQKENSGDIEELSPDDLAAELSWEDKDGKSENHRPSPDQDPFIQSILALQSVQEALENEVQKLGEIGKKPLHDGSVSINSVHVDSSLDDEEFHETSSSGQVASEKITKCASGSLETQVFTLTHKVKYLESKLEEARVVLQAKESRIFDLETSVKSSSRSRKEESRSPTELKQDKYREMEFDLEGLFQQRVESEIEFLVLTSEVEKLKVYVGNQITVVEEQTSLVGEQEQMLNKLGKVESKAVTLKKQADELEKYQENILDVEEVLKIRGRVCKVLSCFFTQLVLLVLVFLFLILQLSTHSGVVVPT